MTTTSGHISVGLGTDALFVLVLFLMKGFLVADRGKVFGIGLGRTGTRSFTEAMKMLGYSPVVHNPGTYTDILEANVEAEGAVLNHWRALMVLYPDAKFVVTLRDSVDDWIESSRRAMEKYPLSRFEGTPQMALAVRNRVHRWGTTEFDKTKLLSHYFWYYGEVMMAFRSQRHRMLQYYAGTGWASLCEFLEQPVPEEDYPSVRD